MPAICSTSNYFGTENDLTALFDAAFTEQLKTKLAALSPSKPGEKKVQLELNFTGFSFSNLNNAQWQHFCTLIHRGVLDIRVLRFDESDFGGLGLEKIQSLFKALETLGALSLLSLNGIDLSIWSEEHWQCLQQLIKTLCPPKTNTSPRGAKKLELGLEKTCIEKLSTNAFTTLMQICTSCSGTVHSANNRWPIERFSLFIHEVMRTKQLSTEGPPTPH